MCWGVSDRDGLSERQTGQEIKTGKRQKEEMDGERKLRSESGCGRGESPCRELDVKQIALKAKFFKAYLDA